MEDAMGADIHRLRDKAGETEKITINLGYVDLGHIDLLVQEGFYSNRTDFIRTAIRNQLSTHGEQVRKSIVRHTLELGLRHYTRVDLEAVKAAGEKLHIKVLGLASIDPDVTPALALATIESITVLGALHASKEIKSALADRLADDTKIPTTSKEPRHEHGSCECHACGDAIDARSEAHGSNAPPSKRLVGPRGGPLSASARTPGYGSSDRRSCD
jgi:Arc/MetJ-type ribon-helix-helix transcriptional regulator